MGDKPILFSGPMVRALLDGRKTQTRRVAKITAIMGNKVGITSPNERLIELDPGEFRRGIFHYESTDALSGPYRLPYAPGDRLWVRETCRAEELSRPPTKRPATRTERQRLGRTLVVETDDLDGADGVRYLSDNHWQKIESSREAGDAWIELYHYGGRGKGGVGNKVPSIYMPRWASRLTLIVTDMRVQRVQEISEADAMAEGVELDLRCCGNPEIEYDLSEHGEPINPREGGCCGKPVLETDPRHTFRNLWDSLNAKRGYGWDENPWVAAYTFTVHHQNIDQMGTPQ